MRRQLALVAAALMLCAGCSAGGPAAGAGGERTDENGGPTASDRVRKAIGELGRGAAGIDQVMELGNAENTYKLTVQGAFDFGADRGRLAADMAGVDIAHVDQKFVGGKVYLKPVAGLESDRWGVVGRADVDANHLLRAPLNDPEHVLAQLERMKEVSAEGEEKIRGVRAVRYAGVLDHATVTLRGSETLRDQMGKAREMLGDDFPVFADVWIDGRGRVVRSVLRMTMQDITSTVTTDYAALAKPVDVEAPDAAQVTPVGEVTGLLSG
ncbi:hypothetical protein G6045_37260 [Streptomyces sp. YC504]|uniref:LppX_LprAFG lipoprotein n=1 Tax=Streptomyces mesophilus TaxID=1775132 RepID=A0A6G4XVM3_9ACTN|nr:hypothetical protein [Streptomyces mesophilus]NGO81273.1 hypothetical protein [Streptomyces mesophilus]